MTNKAKENPYVQDNAMLTSSEVMELLRISRATLWRLTTSGELKGVKIGRTWRFSRSNIEHYMKGEPQE